MKTLKIEVDCEGDHCKNCDYRDEGDCFCDLFLIALDRDGTSGLLLRCNVCLKAEDSK